MSLPTVYESEMFPVPGEGNGRAPNGQAQKSGMLTAFTRHKLLVFFMLLCGLGFGYLHFTRTPVLYQSSTSILLIQQQVPLTHMSSGISYENQLSTQMQIARSPKILRLAVNRQEPAYEDGDGAQAVVPAPSDEVTGGETPPDGESIDGESETTESAAQPADEGDSTGVEDETVETVERESADRQPASEEAVKEEEVDIDYHLVTLSTFHGMSDDEIIRYIVENSSTVAIDDYIFRLTFTGPDRYDCEKVLQKITRAYQQFLEDEYASTGLQLLELLENAEGRLKIELADRQAAYRVFVAHSPLIPLGNAPLNPHSQNLESIIAQRRDAEDRIRNINISIGLVEKFRDSGGNLEAFQILMSEMPLGDFAKEDAAIEARREQLELQIEDLDFQDQQLSVRLGVDHPDRQLIRAQIALLQQRLRRVEEYESAPPADRVAIWLEALQGQLELAQTQLAKLNQEFEAERTGATALRVNELEDAEHRSGINRAQQLYDSVLRQIDEIQLMDDLDRVRTDVIAKPEPGNQIQPVFNTIMTTAGALGILVGLVIGYLLERADASFRSPDDVRDELKIPVIGHIPTFPDRIRLKNADTKMDKRLWAFHRPGGSVAEAFKGIRTSLQFNRHEENHQVLMITSPSPGEGKSTVAANLAISLAHLGKRVLLMDADLRRSAQPRMFGVLEEPGLTNVLVDDVEPFDVIQQTEVAGLSILAGGKNTRNPSELLSSPKMSTLLTVLREQFDYVLIDTPPVLVVTDPLTVAPLADAVIGVLKLTRRTRREATATVERIIDVGGEVLGVVVNGLESGMGYGTGYGYGGYQYTYGYGYGYGRYYSHNEEHGVHVEDQPRRITAS